MEDELKLFQKFLKTQHSLMLLRHNPNDDVENELNETLEETKNNLENFGNNDLSLKAKYAIYDQIQAYIDSINSAVLGLKLLRDQAMMHRDTLFGNFLRDIRVLMTEKIYGFQNPVYLYYTTDQSEVEKNNTVEISDFTQFLENEKTILHNLQTLNFITLDEYFAELRERIIQTFGIQTY